MICTPLKKYGMLLEFWLFFFHIKYLKVDYVLDYIFWLRKSYVINFTSTCFLFVSLNIHALWYCNMQDMTTVNSKNDYSQSLCVIQACNCDNNALLFFFQTLVNAAEMLKKSCKCFFKKQAYLLLLVIGQTSSVVIVKD